jgi:uncharacterized metal-binding protein
LTQFPLCYLMPQANNAEKTNYFVSKEQEIYETCCKLQIIGNKSTITQQQQESEVENLWTTARPIGTSDIVSTQQ